MRQAWEAHARQLATAHGLDPDMVARQIGAESGWNAQAVSPKGAIGLMQLMPATARELGVDPADPMQNIAGGVRYMAQQMRDFGGDARAALAAYNWGPGNVRKHGLDKLPAETAGYIAKVTGMQDDPLAALRAGAAPKGEAANPFDDLVAETRAKFAPPKPVEPARSPQAAPQAAPAPDVPAAPAAAPSAPQAGLRPGVEGSMPGTSSYYADTPLGTVALPKGPVDFVTGMVGRAGDLVGNTGARVADALRLPRAAGDAMRSLAGNRPEGVDRSSLASRAGEFAADLGVTGGAAGLAGGAVRAAAPAFSALPSIAQYMDAAGRALASFGGVSGLPAGAADLAVRSVGAGAAGYLSGQITDPDSAALSGAIGASIPAVGAIAGAAGRTAGDLVRPFTQRGREHIAGEVLRDAVGSNARNVAKRFSQPVSSFAPLTLAERTMDPGISSLQRTLQSTSPEFASELASFQAKQNAARYGALAAMSTGANSPEAIRAARAAATGATYDQIARQFGSEPLNTMGVRRVAQNIAQTPRARTESVAREVQNAISDNPSLGIQRFGTPSEGWRKSVPMADMWGARQNIDQRLYGGSGMDAKSSAQSASAELSRLRAAMSNQLEKIPGFSSVEKVYAQYSKRADAADTLVDMLKKSTTGSADMFGNPVMSGAKMTQALKSIDAKEWGRISRADRTAIQELAQELQNAATAQTLGKAVGSNTVQNAIMAGNMPLALNTAAQVLPYGGLLSGAVGAGTKGAKEKINAILGDALLDPVMAARLASATPTPIVSRELRDALAQITARTGAVAPAGLLQIR